MDIHEGVSKLPFLPCPEMERISEAGDGSLQVTEVNMATHVGTHFDAPSHAIPEGRSIDEYGLDRWITEGIVLEVDAEPLSPIGIEQIRPALDEITPGDAVILRTGWEEYSTDPAYEEHPYLTMEVVDSLLKNRVNWVGMDFLTPDKPPSVREEGFDFPVHTGLLENDVLIAENLTNVREISGNRVKLAAMPLSLRGCDGAPARIAAKPVEPLNL